jgi:hypothetical protein
MQVVPNDYNDCTIEVYGVAEGSWEEDNVTWNNWDNSSKTLTYLGSFTYSTAPGTPASFSGSTLNSWVQKWINGQQANYGLLLKGVADPGLGDSFSSHEDPYDPLVYFGPRLIITHVPENDNVTVTGTVTLGGYLGDLRNVGVKVEFRQGGSAVKTEWVLLDSAGGFSIPNVQKGTYDVAIKTYSHLQEVLLSQNLTSQPTSSLDPITLLAGDATGNGTVDASDLNVIAGYWGAAGD